LRVIKVSTSSIIGAVSLRVKTSEQLFQGKKSDTDEFSAWDRLGTAAAAKILDVVYPATVVNLDPLTVSRGANDGVRPEQTFAILRQGKPITDASGATIAHLEESVGKVQAVKVDQNISLVKPLEGKAFKKGDLAREETPAAGSGAVDAPPPPIRAGAAPTPGQMPKVAVGLIKEGSTAAVKEEKSIPIFTDTIITRLTQTKRFHMLDRQEVDQLLTEQLAQSMRDGKDMQSAFGSLKGADYFVYGSVAVLNVEEKKMKLPGSDRVITFSDGNVQGNMRVVDVKGGQIVESRQVKIQRRIDEPGSVQRVFANLADAFAEEVVASLMNALFPIKVAALAPDGTVYLNRGSDGGLKANEVLTVMRLGQKVVDPDTGVSLGAMETAVAKLTLVEVEDARAKARLESGAAVQPGDVVKRSLSAAAFKDSAAPAPTGATLPGSDASPASGQAAAQPKGKATLAVGLVRLNPSARTTDVKSGHMERITDELVNALNNTNRFLVMERREVDRVLDEKTFTAIAGGDDIRERIKQLKGADYLVMGEVTNFYYDTERRKVPYVNEMETDRTGVMEGNFRIVNGQTGAVVASDKVRLRDQVKNVQDPTRLMTGLMDRFVTQTVGKVVENIYPVKVLAVAQDGMVYLNRGEDGGLKAGVHFEVMRPGPELKDPDTGVSFGREEIKIGLLEVVTVEKFRSKGRLVPNPGATGSIQTVNAGDILRHAGPGAVPKVATKVVQPKW
jgi:curli biogenesis system outer membrane secretion channel CsgG